MDISQQDILWSAGTCMFHLACLVDCPFSLVPCTLRQRNQNGGLTLKTHQTFSALDEVKNRTNYWPFWICVLKKHSGSEITRLSWGHRFPKAPFSTSYGFRRASSVFVWTLGVTVELKLRFQLLPALCGRNLKKNSFFFLSLANENVRGLSFVQFFFF